VEYPGGLLLNGVPDPLGTSNPDAVGNVQKRAIDLFE